MSMGGAEREGDTESEAGSRLQAISTKSDTGLELTDREIMTQVGVGCLTNLATQAFPQIFFFNNKHDSSITWGILPLK